MWCSARCLAFAMSLLLLAATSPAEEVDPWSAIKDPTLRAAREHFSARASQAKRSYVEIVTGARKRFVQELSHARKALLRAIESAERLAVQRGDLDAALEIREAKKSVEADVLPTAGEEGQVGTHRTRTRMVGGWAGAWCSTGAD